MTFTAASTSHPMVPMQMLYVMILTYIFKVKKFLEIIFNI